MSSSPRLVVTHVSHAYGDFVAARDVDLTVGAGEVHCLLGPSGSGKSTLLRLVAGLEVLQQGEIAIAGKTVASPTLHVRPEQRAIGFVFQDYALFPHLAVWRNVAFGMPRGPAKQRRTAAEALLERVGMAGHADAMPHTLSGGQQQRVALARALAREPQVMLLDEPFSGLDARLREDIRQATLEVLRAAEVATLMVTHDPREALVAGDVVSVIREGRLAQTGPPAEVYHRAVSRPIAEVFGPVNVLDGVVAQGTVATPWGTFLAPGLDPGQAAQALVRPEAIEVLGSPNGDGLEATIVDRVFEGGSVQITLERPDSQGQTHLVARDLARSPHRVGDRVGVRLPDTVQVVARS